MIEFERQKKIIDFLITAHSILRDKYKVLSSFFDNALIIISVILNAFVFVDEKFIERVFSINQDQLKLTIGIACVLVLAISVVLIQVRWKETAEKHLKASQQLFRLLQEHRFVDEITDESEKKLRAAEFNLKYQQICSLLPPIPEKKFALLKLKHRRKIELSKLIDRYPSSNLIVLKLRLFISSFKEKK